GGDPGAGSGRALGLPGDLSEEACGAGGGQGLGGEMAHDLHVVVDVIAPVEVEGAGELLDVHHVRHVGFAEAQHGERPAGCGVPAAAERHDLNGDMAQPSDLNEVVQLG